MNFIFFSTSDNFNKFHRKREVDAITNSLEHGRKAILFNKPIFFLKKLLKPKERLINDNQKLIVKNLYIFLPIKLAIKNIFLRYLFIDLPVKLQINKAKVALKRVEDTCYHVYYKPDQYLYLPKSNAIYINYDNYKMDENYFFAQSEHFDDTLRKCIKNSFLSLFSSYKLLHELNVKLNAQSYYYPNAIDRTLIDLTKNYDDNEQFNIEKIVIGFVGQIDNSFDEMLLEEIAIKFKESSIILIGPVSNLLVLKLIEKYENVKSIGFVEYERLGEYINSFDVGICPYKNNHFNKYRNPLKIYEYFSYGKPAVTVECDIDLSLSGVLSISNSYTEFLNNINKEHHSNSLEKSMIRKQIASQNCWDNRAAFLFELIEKNND